MTPGPEDIPMKEMTNGTDIRKDFDYFSITTPSCMYGTSLFFRLAMHVEEIYDKSRFSKIEGMISQMAGIFTIYRKSVFSLSSITAHWQNMSTAWRW